MNEKKNLDRLFQEKFKDFEVAPPEFVWENIQEILEEKKKRRVIPLWFKLSGVAALLVLSGLLATLFFNDAENPATNAPAVVIDNTAATPADAIKATPATGTASPENNSDINTAVASGEENRNAPATQDNTNTLPALSNSNNAVAQEGQNTIINQKNGKRIKRNNAIRQGDAVAVSETRNQKGNNSATANTTGNQNNQLQKSGISNITPATEGVAALDANTARNNNSNKTADQNNAGQKQDVIKSAANEGIAANGSENNSGKNPANAEINPDGKSNTIIDKNIPVTEAVVQTAVDTAASVVPENELEKLLQEKLNGKQDEEKLAEESKKQKERWNIKPQIAPVFYSSLSDGSPINEQFASNSKTYDNDLSYGLGINYAVTDRISIRSGINTVNLSYATNDIAYYASLNNMTNNISQSKTGNIVIQNPGDGVPDTFVIDGQTTQLVEGSMIQKTGYIEVPLEMSYALINKKFGIDVIGGVSTLFLNQNNVSVVSSTGMSTQVGQAQNLNNLHFSTNVGVGFKYRFWDSFQASFEPTFKYQVNAYSRDSGNFKPYFIGLYSGVSFSF